MLNKTINRFISLITCNAQTQVKITIVLMSIIPSLSLFYLGNVIGSNENHVSALNLIIIILLTFSGAVPGFLFLKKYPNNIPKLRKYITDIAEGTLPDKTALVDAQNLDDIQYIEDRFSLVLNEMRYRIKLTEDQLRISNALRSTVERQQQALLEAERHRAMMQTLGAACHHIGQPATVLQIRLGFLRKLSANKEELEEIDECVTAIQTIADILQQLRQVSEFRTVPYVQQTGNAPDETILAIDSKS